MLAALRQPLRRHAVACTAAGCLAAIVYLNALSNPFVYDDHRMVVENTGIQDLADLRAIVLLEPTRPLINFSYAVDYGVWGLNPFGFHLTNLLLHVLNVMLLFQVATRMVADRARSGLTEIAKDPVRRRPRGGAGLCRAPADVAGRRLRGRAARVAVRHVRPARAAQRPPLAARRRADVVDPDRALLGCGAGQQRSRGDVSVRPRALRPLDPPSRCRRHAPCVLAPARAAAADGRRRGSRPGGGPALRRVPRTGS